MVNFKMLQPGAAVSNIEIARSVMPHQKKLAVVIDSKELHKHAAAALASNTINIKKTDQLEHTTIEQNLGPNIDDNSFCVPFADG